MQIINLKKKKKKKKKKEASIYILPFEHTRAPQRLFYFLCKS